MCFNEMSLLLLLDLFIDEEATFTKKIDFVC